jgi:hypothetical protein
MIEMHLCIGARDYFRHNNKMHMISTFNDIIAFTAACRNDAVAAAGQRAVTARGVPACAGNAGGVTLA